ncbi:hypothetical protein AU377_09810 [Sporosarcina sp. HYO08]|nr:YjzD family protein [Sporosarcina sp. HYO08]KXH79773.1 hypothetical protein AU377_09810 [Sporosarcina sp. HYO08]
MQYIMTFVWSFFLITMLNYVVSSINSVPFEFVTGLIVSAIISVVIILLGEALPNEPVKDY